MDWISILAGGIVGVAGTLAGSYLRSKLASTPPPAGVDAWREAAEKAKRERANGAAK